MKKNFSNKYVSYKLAYVTPSVPQTFSVSSGHVSCISSKQKKSRSSLWLLKIDSRVVVGSPGFVAPSVAIGPEVVTLGAEVTTLFAHGPSF